MIPEKIRQDKLAWKKTPACKTCNKRYWDRNSERLNAKHRERYAENPELFLQRIREWKQNNPVAYQAIVARANHAKRERHNATAINDLSGQQWEEIKAAYGFCCVYCGKKKPLERDHLTPSVLHGSTTATNIVPACRSCNVKKGKGAPLTPVQPLLLTIAPSKPRTTYKRHNNNP